MKRASKLRQLGLLTIVLLTLGNACNWPDVVDNNSDITLYVLPSPVKGGTFEMLEMQAITEGEIPEDARYVWDFGDGSETIEQNNNNSVSHMYFFEGTYNITIELYDNSTNHLMDKTYVAAEISWNFYNLVHQYNYLRIQFEYTAKKSVEYLSDDFQDHNYETQNLTVIEIENVPLFSTDEDCPLIWEDYAFSVNLAYTGKNIANQNVTRTGVISGEINPDGTLIRQLEAHQTDIIEVVDQNSGSISMVDRYNEISLKNVPFIVVNIITPFEVIYGESGAEVDQLLYSQTNYFTWHLEDSRYDYMEDYYAVVYDDLSTPPVLNLVFSGPLFLE